MDLLTFHTREQSEQYLHQWQELVQLLHDCTCELAKLKKDERDKLPMYVEEYTYILAPQTATSITVTPQCTGVIRTALIIAYAVNASTLQLGDRTIPLPAGANILQNTGFLLRRRDVRQLSQTPAGAMSLEITGQEIPERGMW